MGIVVAEYLETKATTVIVGCPCGNRLFLMWSPTWLNGGIGGWTKDEIIYCSKCRSRLALPPEMFETRKENPEAIIGKVIWIES